MSRPEGLPVPSLTPVGDEIMLPKTSSGVFNSTNVDYLLKNLGIRYLIVVGILTDQCVDMAVRDAADRGYLVENGLKYSEGTVSVSAAVDEEAVQVTVADEGAGIDPDHIGRIFTKFFRGDAGATGITGTGLGLAVSREIVLRSALGGTGSRRPLRTKARTARGSYSVPPLATELTATAICMGVTPT
jgi:hypothetical protein